MPRTTPDFGDTVKVGNCRVEAIYLSFVANMLRKHAARKTILYDMEESVIKATPVEDLTGMPKAPGSVGDPTRAAAFRLMDENEPTFGARARMRQDLAAVEAVLAHLPIDQREIIRELYFRRRLTLLGVARVMNMTKTTVCRKRNRALLAFATEIIGEHILLPLGKT